MLDKLIGRGEKFYNFFNEYQKHNLEGVSTEYFGWISLCIEYIEENYKDSKFLETFIKVSQIESLKDNLIFAQSVMVDVLKEIKKFENPNKIKGLFGGKASFKIINSKTNEVFMEGDCTNLSIDSNCKITAKEVASNNISKIKANDFIQQGAYIYESRLELLKNDLDRALDQGNKELFMKLSEKYNKMIEA